MKLKILEYILAREPEFPSTEKWWIVNHIYDPELRRQACRALEHYKARYMVLPFREDDFNLASTPLERMVAAIPINRCRNIAVDFGKSRFDYTAVMDGDCYIPKFCWQGITQGINADNGHAYYTVPMVRSSIQLEESGVDSGLVDEPQVIFHKSADIRFDEALPWGNFNDKLDVLIRLGHEHSPGRWHMLREPGLAQTVGNVRHLASGPIEAELEPDPAERAGKLWNLREHSFYLFLSRLGIVVMPNLTHNPQWPFHY